MNYDYSFLLAYQWYDFVEEFYAISSKIKMGIIGF